MARDRVRNLQRSAREVLSHRGLRFGLDNSLAHAERVHTERARSSFSGPEPLRTLATR